MPRKQDTDRLQFMAEPIPNTLEAAIVRALDRPPAIRVPDGFAARVAAHSAAEPKRGASLWAGFGPRVALVSGAVITASMFAFAPHASPSVLNLHFDMEMLLLAELGLVGYVLTRVGLRE